MSICEVFIASLNYIKKINQDGVARSEYLTGSDWYYAPEMINQFFDNDSSDQNLNYSQKCDVWALGSIFCELITGYHPLEL